MVQKSSILPRELTVLVQTGGAKARVGDALTRGGAGGRAVQPAGPELAAKVDSFVVQKRQLSGSI